MYPFNSCIVLVQVMYFLLVSPTLSFIPSIMNYMSQVKKEPLSLTGASQSNRSR